MIYFSLALFLLNLACGVLCGWLAVVTERRRRSNVFFSVINFAAAILGAYNLLSAS